MEDIIALVQTTLAKNSNTYWREYLKVYQKATGIRWQGCRCESDNLKKALEDWYNKNK